LRTVTIGSSCSRSAGLQRPLDELTERMQRTVDASFEEIDACSSSSPPASGSAPATASSPPSVRARRPGGDRAQQGRPASRRRTSRADVRRAKLAAGPKALAAGARFRADHPTAEWVDNFRALHPVSAKTGRRHRLRCATSSSRYSQKGRSTSRRNSAPDLSEELQVAELIREKALGLTRDEVPHAISVEIEEVEEKVLRASILVETDSQKQILVGKGGAMVKDIGTRARPEIEALLGHSVFLELKVKVRPRWRRDAATLERLGL
jgi:hypothetical protein